MLGSFALQAGFIATPCIVVLLLVILVHRYVSRGAAIRFGVAVSAWSAVTFALAGAGWLAHFDFPPRALPLFALGTLAVIVLVTSSFGAKLASAPWTWLIGLQVFRLPVELLIHQAVVEGVAPPQLSWEGYNLDILTALTALPAAWLASRGRLSRGWLAVWNLAGLALVGTVVIVAVLSMPTPFQQLKPDNTWIAWAPYIWLPLILVMTALMLHGLCFRKLLATSPG